MMHRICCIAVYRCISCIDLAGAYLNLSDYVYADVIR